MDIQTAHVSIRTSWWEFMTWWGWNVELLLDSIIEASHQGRCNALIDTGALITGLTNQEVGGHGSNERMWEGMHEYYSQRWTLHRYKVQGSVSNELAFLFLIRGTTLNSKVPYQILDEFCILCWYPFHKCGAKPSWTSTLLATRTLACSKWRWGGLMAKGASLTIATFQLLLILSAYRKVILHHLWSEEPIHFW